LTPPLLKIFLNLLPPTKIFGLAHDVCETKLTILRFACFIKLWFLLSLFHHIQTFFSHLINEAIYSAIETVKVNQNMFFHSKEFIRVYLEITKELSFVNVLQNDFETSNTN
jgi:hypothetical protein